MKASFLLIGLFVSGLSIGRANNWHAPTATSPLTGDIYGTAALAQQQAVYAQYAHAQQIQAEILAAEQAELVKIYSKDTWRRIGETTNLARGPGWSEFQGEIQETLPGGVVFKGRVGQILSIHTDPSYEEHLVQRLNSNQQNQGVGQNSQTTIAQVRDTSIQRRIIYGDDVFFVEGFPYPANMGLGYEQMMALEGGYFSYTNNNRQLITIHKLIYGTPCQKLFSEEEIEVAKQKADAKKQAAVDNVLKYNLNLANKGDAYGLLRMGERYRDGDGVQKDLTKARDYLTKAVAAGSPTAADELKALPTN